MRTIRMLEDYPALFRIFDLFAEDEMAVFLDSSLQNELGQYSIVGVFPYLTLKNGDKFTVNGEECGQGFEAYVKEYLKNHRDENDTGLPIVSGAVGYFSYDYGRKKEGVESRHKKEVDIPACVLCFYDVFLVESHEDNRLYLIANGNTKDSGEMLDEILKRIREVPDEEEKAAACEIQAESDFEESEYLKAVDDVIDYITEGDIYIMNMTRQLTVRSRRSPYQVFQALRRDNPSPFGGYFQYGDFQVVCASPERFLQMKGGHVVTRPIKGTRKRGENPQEDAMLRKELWESEKDRSELLMIVDLERNDLNRVCVPGSVKVTELFQIEKYATVFHLTANVEGELAQGKNVMDLIEAAFPGGSITGAPKLRAMEIIDELEHGRRNLYTGSMGYLTLDGECDFNIVIRTALYQDGVYHLGVGGGITCESERGFEYEETQQKAKAVLEAMQG
ncbi:aminodeoxychorismate synthase component I [Lachnospiraceae bacterium 46-15]